MKMKTTIIVLLVLILSVTLYKGCDGWVPVVIAGKTYKVISKISAKERFDSKFPDYKFNPYIVKKVPEKAQAVTVKPWVPKSQMDLKFPPHLFRQQK